ncbi:hypothetical protein LH67_15055 [Xenorhabdus nematophila]|nr:hypothetical protein LH67_15055 [Xenorhabdus nematophila]
MIPPKLRFVIISAFPVIGYLRELHNEEKKVRAGFMVLKYFKCGPLQLMNIDMLFNIIYIMRTSVAFKKSTEV